MDGVIQMEEYIELNLTPFEQFMESTNVELDEMDDADLYSEMLYTYEDLCSMYQEGEIWDAAIGAGKKESLIVKILKFIPRLVGAAVRKYLGHKTKAKAEHIKNATPQPNDLIPFDMDYYNQLIKIAKGYNSQIGYDIFQGRVLAFQKRLIEKANSIPDHSLDFGDALDIGEQLFPFNAIVTTKSITASSNRVNVDQVQDLVFDLYFETINISDRVAGFKTTKSFDVNYIRTWFDDNAASDEVATKVAELTSAYFTKTFLPRLNQFLKAVRDVVNDTDKFMGSASSVEDLNSVEEYMI